MPSRKNPSLNNLLYLPSPRSTQAARVLQGGTDVGIAAGLSGAAGGVCGQRRVAVPSGPAGGARAQRRVTLVKAANPQIGEWQPVG